jgi:asparagine synthase (glutamine-hydrolysing)
MCGIAGLIMLDGSKPDRAALEAMTRAVAHRGPDGEGVEVVGPVGFGHRRLAIIDLSDAGRQPMSAEDGRLRIVFNGEIYNYVELRDELTGLGERFRTATDTEVILAAYRRWGTRCVDRFNGMWAFAIHDTVAHTVFCSRDRFGVKPFYYAQVSYRGGEAFAFGSEIRQLLPLLPAIRAERAVVRDFLFAGIDEPIVESYFEGVRKLPGSHSLTIDLRSGSISLQREYEIAPHPELADIDDDRAVELYRKRLQDSVRLRLRSDVPVGTCLSGGLDSSSVAALAARPYLDASGKAFRAITAVSEEPGNDETPFANAVAGAWGLDWITVRPQYRDFAATINEVVRTQEEPFGGPSICMQWFVMRAARQHGIPVMLDGQGGDETLLGYRRYFAPYLLDQLRLGGPMAMVREILACRREDAQLSTRALLTNLALQGLPLLNYAKLRVRARWMRQTPEIPQQLREEAVAARNLGMLQRLDIEHVNLPALLRFEDKNSMHFGVETRLPFLDWRAVETALSLPPRCKFRHGWTKWVLRRAMNDLLPAEVTWRRWKVGFEAPTTTWLRAHAAPMLEAVLGSSLLTELGDRRKLERSYLSMHASTRWRLFSVAMWEREFGVR